MKASSIGFASLLALVAAVFLVPGAGCDDSNPLTQAQADLCCSEFTVGADLRQVDWEADANFALFMQATADLAAVATAVVADVGASCRTLAVDLGATEQQQAQITATDPADFARAWCNLAVTRINDTFRPQGQLVISVVAQPPVCTASVSATAACEANCAANLSAGCEAELGDVEARCEPGELSVKCDGACRGTCQGSANLAVACTGTCEGTCQGRCDGTCEGNSGQGVNCNSACDGRCRGECRGSCEIEGNANVECSGECKGECTGTATAPKCQGRLEPPSAECQAQLDAECAANCDASASARAECKPPSVEVVVEGNAQVSVQAVASLKMNLPAIVTAFRARGQLLVDNAQAVASFAARIDPAALSLKAAACLLPAANAVDQALVNAQASLEASAVVASSVGL